MCIDPVDIVVVAHPPRSDARLFTWSQYDGGSGNLTRSISGSGSSPVALIPAVALVVVIIVLVVVTVVIIAAVSQSKSDPGAHVELD